MTPLKPKDRVLEFIDTLSPYQWRTYLSYILMPRSKLPEPVRVDLANAAIGEGRCATVACFEEAFEEVKAYVNRLCDLKMSFDLVPSSQVDLARLRGAIGRELILVIRDMDHLSPGIFEEYLSLSRYRASGSLGVSPKYGLVVYGMIPRRTKYGNPEAAAYNKLGRGLYRLLTQQRKALGFHIVRPEDLGTQSKPILDPESPYSDSYLVNSFFSRYKEKFIVDTGIKSVWR